MEAGVYSYKYLPLPGAFVIEDPVDVASYSYDPVKRELVSYDVPEIVRIKAEYVASNSLGGCMFWEVCCVRIDIMSSLPKLYPSSRPTRWAPSRSFRPLVRLSVSWIRRR